jgi:hypothetical protein
MSRAGVVQLAGLHEGKDGHGDNDDAQHSGDAY